MSKSIVESCVFRYHWWCRELELFSLCFADDLLLFCQADVDLVRVFKEGLDEFSMISGLKVLGFQVGELPLRYLGLPLLHSRLTVRDWKPLLLKVDKLIASWTAIPLSFAGQTQPIKTVLNPLNGYWSATFVLPKGVIKLIEGKL
ncbi:UNVERIFIED_CONTAM: hypothetical protein Sangu_2405000 [Sesamum angustifolium]|uniref:Reverse transcriptase domain-containing protein n=1 Tax=Sesamum angustifolium TaxID=2727405 RepID=A0AAW2KX11_9LAMI